MPKFERMEVYEGPNSEGKSHFALFWWADYHPGAPVEHERRLRGQHFRAKIEDYKKECKEFVDLRSANEKV